MILLFIVFLIPISTATLKLNRPGLIKINGVVEIISGDQMPKVSSKRFSMESSKNSEVKIIAIPGKVKMINDNVFIPLENIPPGGIIKKTNSKGEFVFTLKPGKYTFLVIKDNKAYRNNFDSQGFFTQTDINKNTNNLIIVYDKFAYF